MLTSLASLDDDAVKTFWMTPCGKDKKEESKSVKFLHLKLLAPILQQEHYDFLSQARRMRNNKIVAYPFV